MLPASVMVIAVSGLLPSLSLESVKCFCYVITVFVFSNDRTVVGVVDVEGVDVIIPPSVSTLAKLQRKSAFFVSPAGMVQSKLSNKV